MRGHLRHIILPAHDRLVDLRARLKQRRGPVDMPAPPENIAPIEDAIYTALHPVGPSVSFRENLRHNLAIAVERKRTGLTIDCHRPLHDGLVIGISVGTLAAMLAVVALAIRSHFIRPRA